MFSIVSAKSKTGSWWYSVSCATLLFATAVLKLHTVFTSSSLIVEAPDPVFQVSNRFLMLAVALMEIGVAGALLMNFLSKINLVLIGGMGLAFLGYHILSWIIGETTCPCLGRVVTLSPWLDSHQNVFIWAIILYMLSGPFLLLPVDKNEKEKEDT
ncbi:MAG: hypothetical protein EOM12_11400 [Verrucomicrobiae bacterium]|nr:hypothetical protein [Verrucomicrobiae bacterium]